QVITCRPHVMLLLYFELCTYHEQHSFPTRRSSDLRSKDHWFKSSPPQPSKSRSCTAGGAVPRPSTLRIPRHPYGAEPLSFAEREDRKSTRLNSSHVSISYAVFCLKK